MSDAHRYAVILAGGRGERFWPLSTSRRPKQLLSLVGEGTLLAQAVDRLEGLVPPDRVFVITSRDLVEASHAAAPALPRGNIIGEPMGRDTAAAVALAAALVRQRDPEAVFCILTADHVIGDLADFRGTLANAMDLSLEQDVLVTIGIQPDHPSTGYGYIEAGEPLDTPFGTEFFRAERFVEKPPERTAREYLASGKFYWNSGMFIWSVPAIFKAFHTHRRVLAELMDRLVDAIAEHRLDAALDEAYPGLDRISIDYALMEHAENIVVAAGVFAWDDVGAWPAIANHLDKDEDDNVRVGSSELLDSAGNIVVSDDRLTALVGVRDLVVVQAEGVTLVCARDRAQDIKHLVVRLRENGAYDHLL